jgi:O-antigen/teichoic acid export membrane protein
MIISKIRQSAEAKLVTGAVFGNLIYLALTPIITRLYSPSDFGIYAVLLVYIGIHSTLALFRLETSFHFAPTRDLRYIKPVLQKINIVTSFLAIPILLIFRHKNFFGFGEMPLWIIFATPPSLALIGKYAIAKNIRLRESDFSSLARSGFSKISGLSISRVVFGFAASGSVYALVLADVFSYLLGLYSIGIRPRASSDLGLKNLRRELIVLKKYLLILRLDIFSAGIGCVAAAAPVFCLAMLFDSSNVGVYALAATMLTGSFSQLAGLIADSFTAKFSSSIRNDDLHTARAIYSKYRRNLFYLSSVFLIFTTLIIKKIDFSIFGDRWAHLDDVLLILLYPACVILTVSPLSRLIVVFNHYFSKLVFDLSMFMSTVAISFFAYFWNLDFNAFLKILVISQCFCYGVYFLAINKLGKRRLWAGGK